MAISLFMLMIFLFLMVADLASCYHYHGNHPHSFPATSVLDKVTFDGHYLSLSRGISNFGRSERFYFRLCASKISSPGPLSVLSGKLSYLCRIPMIVPFESATTRMFRVYEEGHGFDSFVQSLMVDRADVIDKLKPILQPEWSTSYAVIIGGNGCGKTVAIQQALSALEWPKGVVYINCPYNPTVFSLKLKDVVEYYGRMKVPVASRNEPCETFYTLSRSLLETAALFRSKHHRPMVLIIDSADRIAEKLPDFFDNLQDFAKDCADSGNLRIVFVISNSSTLMRLKSRSAKSRMSTILEIGDIPDEDAVQYLTNEGISGDEARLAVANITGGRFTSLLQYIDSKRRFSYDALYEIRARGLDATLVNMGLPLDHKLFQKLVENGYVSAHEIWDSGLNRDQLNHLLDSDILAYHPNVTYTFGNRFTATWFSTDIQKINVKGKIWSLWSSLKGALLFDTRP